MIKCLALTTVQCSSTPKNLTEPPATPPSWADAALLRQRRGEALRVSM